MESGARADGCRRRRLDLQWTAASMAFMGSGRDAFPRIVYALSWRHRPARVVADGGVSFSAGHRKGPARMTTGRAWRRESLPLAELVEVG